MKHFVGLLDQVISAGEKEGLEKMFGMLLALRQQMHIMTKADRKALEKYLEAEWTIK